MSANCSEAPAARPLGVLCLTTLCAVMLASCVSRAEQVASRDDTVRIGQLVEDEAFERLEAMGQERFREHLAAMVRTPIDFHGRVEDEEGRPLPGAQVTMIVFDRLLEPFEFPYLGFAEVPKISVDADGRIRARRLRGAVVYVVVRVPGHQPVTPARRSIRFAPGPDLVEPPPTAADPARFVFEPLPDRAELVPVHTGALLLPGDGAPLEFSLREPRPWGVEPGTGDGRVTCTRARRPEEGADRFTWSCELTIPGGGIQAAQLTMDRAPESGYEESLRFEFPEDLERWDDRHDALLVAQLRDGTYALLEAHFRMSGDFFVAFDGRWNRTGSTWLD